MSKTGTYRVEAGKLVKVSDEVPRLKQRVYVKRGGQYFENLGPEPVWIRDAAHKRRVLRELKLEEAG